MNIRVIKQVSTNDDPGVTDLLGTRNLASHAKYPRIFTWGHQTTGSQTSCDPEIPNSNS